MHICVCIKQTPDSSSVYVDPVTGQADWERFVQILNPADACAVEAAVRLKEQFGATISAFTFGPHDTEGALRAALAIGADNAIRIWPQYNQEPAEWGAFMIADALAVVIQQAGPTPDLVLCGETSSDWASGAVGPALAERLGLPQITRVEQLKVSNEQHMLLQATRKLERGYRELLEAELPLLMTVTSSLNEPRYPSLPSHLASLTAKIPVCSPEINKITFTGLDETLLEMHTPRPRPRRIATPDSTHSAFQRIGEIIAGGTTSRKNRLVEGSPEELATELVEFLRSKGFIAQQGGREG